MSKSQKKNQKRASKNKQTEGFDVEESVVGAGPLPTSKPRHDPVQELREKLAQAKADKNHDLANKLRQELWITQDLAAGYKPKLASEDKDSQEALTKVVDTLAPSNPSISAKFSSTAPSTSVTSTSSLGEDERKLKTLTKKLDQIQKLKKKQEQGVTLEANQLAKIKTEEEILEDIEHLQKLLSIPAKR